MALSCVATVVACHAVSGLEDFVIGATAGGAGGMAGAAAATGGAGGGGGDGGDAPRDCRAVQELLPNAADDFYLIDPDGAGGDPPFEALCDMVTDGGGWTRFHWAHEALPVGTDPLGGALPECDKNANSCLGRIPLGAQPTEILVKDISQGEHAAWRFDASVISNAVLAAFTNGERACITDANAWMPYLDTSSELYCGTGNEGGCDSFMYDDGCVGLPGWSLQLDGDLFYASSAFKLGYMRTGGNCGEDPIWDHGYLNTMACTDEHGELYFR